MKQTASPTTPNIKRGIMLIAILLITLTWLTACSPATSPDTESETTKAAITEAATNEQATTNAQATEDIQIKNGGKIAADKAKERLDSDEAIILVDVRTEQEYNEGHIPDALLLPLQTIKTDAATLIPELDATYFVYCRSGARSAEAVKILLDMGYTAVYDLGGIINWPYEIELP